MTEVPLPTAVDRAAGGRGRAVQLVRRTTGSTVDAGQTLAEVQVDKVAADVPAPVSGTVHLLVEEEAVVTQGRAIATID